MGISETARRIGVNTLFSYLEKDPEKNIPKALDWLEKFDKNGSLAAQLNGIRRYIADPDSNWAKLVYSLFTDIDNHELKTLVNGLVLNGSIDGLKQQMESEDKYDCSIPWAILMDPTSACNLHCTGCWAAEYGNRMNLSFDDLDRIISQGKELGIYVYLYSGGEPLVRRDDIIRLCEKHNDCAFLSFTNGTLIDDHFADEMLRVGNFIPAISIEGFEEATDSRRGAGTYQKVLAAMERLKKRKLLFGISCCYTSANYQVIGSSEYFDSMIEMGAKFAWLFTYMPIGNDAVPELMVTAEQRKYMFRTIRQFRDEKPIFTMDFWNDGEFTGGCIAGGRAYCHINANGDMEPCAFIHYSDRNIKECSLLEAFQSPLFRSYRAHQPFNNNMYRPCPVLDNPGALTEMVEAVGAHSTDMVSPEAACDYCGKCEKAAAAWTPVADALWAEKPYVRSGKKLLRSGHAKQNG